MFHIRQLYRHQVLAANIWPEIIKYDTDFLYRQAKKQFLNNKDLYWMAQKCQLRSLGTFDCYFGYTPKADEIT